MRRRIAPPPIERERRLRAAQLLRAFVEARITNDELEDGWPLGRGDPALNGVFDFVWFFYDDMSTHRFKGDANDAARLLRCADFLESDDPYIWRNPSWLLRILLFPVSILTFGGINLLLNHFVDRPAYWPCSSPEAEERHRPPMR